MAARFEHRIGVVTIEGGEVVNRMVVGKGRKQRSIEQRWAVASLVAMRRFRDAYGLNVTFFTADRQMGDSVEHCGSEPEVEAFTAALVAANPAIETNLSLSDTALPRDEEAARHEKPLVDVVTYKDAKGVPARRKATDRQWLGDCRPEPRCEPCEYRREGGHGSGDWRAAHVAYGGCRLAADPEPQRRQDHRDLDQAV
jgi:hypothetical protein